MVDRAALLSAFEDYAHALLHPYDIGEMLYRLTDQVVDVLGVDGAGVSIARNDRLSFLTSTGTAAAVLEEFQSSSGHGPSHLAYREGQQVRVNDLGRTDDWPEYGRVAIEQGLHAVAALPMPVHERRVGALDLYRAEPHEWGDDELRIAQLLANMASGYIRHNVQLSESRSLAEQLQQALDSRIIVEQAKGVLSGRNDIPPNQAFELLRTHARTTSIRLHDVCEHVVEGRLRL